MLEATKKRPDIGRTGPKINGPYFNARKFLELKLDEIIATTRVPALGAVLVRDGGKMIISGARGKRKLGAAGAANEIQPTDKWCLASISKPITGTAIAAMIERGIGGIDWKTTLNDYMPEVFDQDGAHDEYKQATLELMMAHSAGFGYNPAGEPQNMWIEENTPAYLNDDMVRLRRLLFTRAYVLDEPLYPPGRPGDYEGDPKDRYSGGPIVCATMYEDRTGERFDYLVRRYVFDPLGMTNSGWGRPQVGPQGGMWLHHWVSKDKKLEVDPLPHELAQDFHTHTPVGCYCLSAEDFGKFLAEFLVDDPKTMNTDTRDYVMTNNPAAGQSYLSSGWSGRSSNALRHSGESGFCYATCKVDLDDVYAVGAAANSSSIVGKPAVGDAINALATLRTEWDEIAGTGSALRVYHPCVHPTPGLIARSSGVAYLVGRKHDGSLERLKKATGVTATWPGMIGTSGVACAASSDGDTLHVAVRGTDNNIWHSRSRDGGVSFSEFKALPAKSCRSGPALACSSDGTWLYAVALDSTGKTVFSASPDRGQFWSDWTRIGGHICTSQPGIACSNDGQVIHVVARGAHWNILYNVSHARGSDWGDNWRDWSGLDIFSSGPTVICDGDGERVRIGARETGRTIIWTKIPDDGGGWEIFDRVGNDWQASSSPVFARKGEKLVAAAYGEDHFPYASVGDFDGNWSDWQKVGTTRFI